MTMISLDDYRSGSTPPGPDRRNSRRAGGAGKATPPAGLLPARLHPRPVRTATRRVARSHAAADLKDAGVVIGLLLAVAIALIWLDPTAQDLINLVNGDAP